MNRRRVVFVAYLALSLGIVPLVMAGPGAGTHLSSAVAGLGSDAANDDPATEWTTFCLIEEYDITLTDVRMEVRHQTGTPFTAQNLTMSAHVPRGDPDDYLVFENDRATMDRLCSTLSLKHAPIKVIMENVTITDLSIRGRAIEQDFDRGYSRRLVLYISLDSGLKLLPKILFAAVETSGVSTESWERSWGTNATAYADPGPAIAPAVVEGNRTEARDSGIRSPAVSSMTGTVIGTETKTPGIHSHAVRRTHAGAE